MIPIEAVLALGIVLFAIGLIGVLARKNLIVILMALELLLNGVNVVLVGFALRWGNTTGQVFALFVVMIAVAEAAVGFALMLSYFRHRETYSLDEINDLKG